MKEVGQVRRELRRQLGREPEVQEIARALYTPERETGRALPEDLFPNDAIAPSQHNSDQEPESTRLLREITHNLLAPLLPRERAILEFRFGLLDGRPRTLAEVAEQFSIPHQAIRQIEIDALKKLRHPTRSHWP